MAITVIIPTTPDREPQLARCIAGVKASVCDQRIDIMTELNEYEGFVKPVLRVLHRVEGLCLILGNDAVVRHDSIQKLFDVYVKTFPKDDGVCYPIDERANVTRLPSHPFGHSRTLRLNIYPKYFHNFVDKDLGQVMWRRGKLKQVPESVIDHFHHVHKKAAYDMTYKIADATSDADGEIYFQRMQRGFDLDPKEVVADLNKFPHGPF